MKKIYFVITSLISLLLTSCRGLYFADKYFNVKWISSDPQIEFTVLEEYKGLNKGTIINEDNKIDVYCVWTLTNALEIYFADKVDPDSGGLSSGDIAIRGQYKMRKNVVKLLVDNDNVFNCKYEYIFFTMSDL